MLLGLWGEIQTNFKGRNYPSFMVILKVTLSDTSTQFSSRTMNFKNIFTQATSTVATAIVLSTAIAF